MEPFAGFRLATLHTGGFAEAGDTGLTGPAQASSLATTTLGLRASATLDALRVTASLGWQHILGPAGTTSTQHFAGGADFTISGVPVPRDAVTAGFDLDLKLSEMAHLSLGYAGSLAPAGNSQSATAQFHLRF